MADTDLGQWEHELGRLAQRSELLARADARPWGWRETIALIAALAAGPVGFLIGLLL